MDTTNPSNPGNPETPTSQVPSIPGTGEDDAEEGELVGPAPEVRRAIEVVLEQQYRRAPLPRPEELKAYDVIVPGAADRILGMAETEQRHRHSLDLRDSAERKRGQWFALIAALGFAVLAGLAFVLGYPVEASILGSGTVVSLVTAFIIDRRHG